MVRGGAEEADHERLLYLLGNGASGELEEFLIPDGPMTVEVAAAVGIGVVTIFGHAEITFETGAASEGLEAHGRVGRTMEEG